MADIDQFDRRLAAAVQAFADGARTEVDAVAVATRAARGRRPGAAGWLGRTVPVPILLLLVGLLALSFSTLAASGWRPLPGLLFPTVLPSSSVSPSAHPTASPTPDPLGPIHVSGTETVNLGTVYSTDSGDLSGGIESVFTRTNDARVNGTGSFEFTVSLAGTVGTWTGTYRLAMAEGAWQGTCSGSTWNSGLGAVGTCWLTGSGGFAGLTYVRSYSWLAGEERVEGVIYPGSPPGS